MENKKQAVIEAKKTNEQAEASFHNLLEALPMFAEFAEKNKDVLLEFFASRPKIMPFRKNYTCSSFAKFRNTLLTFDQLSNYNYGFQQLGKSFNHFSKDDAKTPSYSGLDFFAKLVKQADLKVERKKQKEEEEEKKAAEKKAKLEEKKKQKEFLVIKKNAATLVATDYANGYMLRDEMLAYFEKIQAIETPCTFEELLAELNFTPQTPVKK